MNRNGLYTTHAQTHKVTASFVAFFPQDLLLVVGKNFLFGFKFPEPNRPNGSSARRGESIPLSEMQQANQNVEKGTNAMVG